MLLAEDSLFEKSDELRDWRRALDVLAIDPEERKAHITWLFRKGLSNEAGIGSFYSFCNKEWVKEEDYRHCSVCNKCYSVHVSWHCGVCKQCRHDGLDEPCRRCGGTSLKAKPRPEDDFGDLESEMTRARVSALMHGGTSQASGSQSGAQVVRGPSVATPLPGSLSQLSTDIGEECTPYAEGALSPVGPSLHGNLRGTNTQPITQNTSRLPIVQSRVETIRATGSATRVAPARLTASNLEQHTHLNSHNLSDIRHGASSQQSEDTEAVERGNADFVHRTIEDRSDRSCECVDGCRTSDCTCVLMGTLCSLNCRCNIDTGDDDRWGGCFSSLRRFNDKLLRHHYFGASSHHTVNFSKCFASRVLAFLSGELSIASIQGGPQRPSHRLISSAEMSLIEKLPGFELGAEFVKWVRQSQSMDSNNHKRWLLRIALGEGHGIQDQWKSSFCEKKWLYSRVWMHCAACRRCHRIDSATEDCHD
jgi:hypothetical protein